MKSEIFNLKSPRQRRHGHPGVYELHRRIQAFAHALPPPQPPGLGDHVFNLLHPIALKLDTRFGTHFAQCKHCDRRRAWLNRFGNKLRRLPRCLRNTAAALLRPLRRRAATKTKKGHN